jgi:hypothetical protein
MVLERKNRIMKISMMKPIILILVTLSLVGCITRKTTRDSQGIVIEDKYIIKRPIKTFVNNVEME